MPSTPVVLDVDTGVDDACALLLAARHPALDLRGVTCVDGNAPLSDVVRNTLTVLEACGREDVPVAAGATRPLLKHPVAARHVHGADGMADLGRPAPSMPLDPRHAVELLRDAATGAAESGQPLTLVPLAPMTNVALFARTHPLAFALLERVVFMGGGAMVTHSTGSNATAAAEFNVFHDPEAAAVVLDACVEHDVPVTMYGLDVFFEPVVTLAQAEELDRLDDDGPGSLAAGLVRFLCGRFRSDRASIGDAGAVAALVAPGAARTSRLPVRVELAGTWTRGRTIVGLQDWSGGLDHDPHDPHDLHGRAPAAVDVTLDIDADTLVGVWLDAVRGGR